MRAAASLGGALVGGLRRWRRSSRSSGRPTTSPRSTSRAKLQPPSAAHWLGTDHFGRDVFSMIMVGARVSIAVALVAVGIGMGFGVPLGLLAAARRGSLLDEVIMRGNDLVFAFPSLLIAIMITAVFGPSALNAIIAIGIFNVPVFARLTRGAALSLWTRDFVLAARVAGKGRGADLGRAHPAEPHQPPDRAGDDPVLARHPRRGRALLCRARGAAADAVLGADAGREPDDGRASRRGWRCSRGSRSC